MGALRERVYHGRKFDTVYQLKQATVLEELCTGTHYCYCSASFITASVNLVNDTVFARAKQRCNNQPVSPNQSITPRSSLSVVHSGDVTVQSDGPECTVTSPECTAGTGERGLTDWLGDTAARVPTKQIPHERETVGANRRIV